MKRLTQRRPIQEELSYSRRKELEYGRPMFNSDEPLPESELRELWDRHGEAVIADYIQRWPGKRPWAFWKFDMNMKRPENEFAYLRGQRLMSADEIEAMKHHPFGQVK